MTNTKENFIQYMSNISDEDFNVVITDNETTLANMVFKGRHKSFVDKFFYDAFSISPQKMKEDHRHLRTRSVMVSDGVFVKMNGNIIRNNNAFIFVLNARKGTGKIGLVIGRFQPVPHKGHIAIINLALKECDIVIIGIGSTQIKGVARNPMGWEMRDQFLSHVFKDRIDDIRKIPLVDINSMDSNDDWVRYVLGQISSRNLPTPTDYFTGSVVDGKWYFSEFASDKDPMIYDDGVVKTYQNKDTGYRMNILCRIETGYLSATEVRSLIERRDDMWKDHVPTDLIKDVEENYPGHLRVAIRVEDNDYLPNPEKYPLGTSVIWKKNRYVKSENGSWEFERETIEELYKPNY